MWLTHVLGVVGGRLADAPLLAQAAPHDRLAAHERVGTALVIIAVSFTGLTSLPPFLTT